MNQSAKVLPSSCEVQASLPCSIRPERRQPSAQLILDQIECGLVQCDADGHIFYANRAAQRELMSARVLLRGPDNRLVEPPAGSGRLALAFRQAAMRGRRSLICLGEGRARLVVSVQPLKTPEPGEVRAGGDAVLVVLGRREPCSALGLELLAACHGLTLAEQRVLAGLLRRATPREIAVEHGVMLTTVRTQIQAVRAKLDVRSVDELLLRVAALPPVAGVLPVQH